MSWGKLKQYIPIISIILLATFFRFIYLNNIPNAMGGDELIYAITAKSIFLTGHDITGTWNPLSVFFFRYPPGQQQAELPYFLHLFFSAPFPFSLFLAKLPFALLGVGTVILLYTIAKELFGKTVGTATGLIAAINPWLLIMSRTAYESTPATFFYLLALYILLKARSWHILWALLPLLFAFYSYIATKLLFLPFVVIAISLAYCKQKRQYGKQYAILFFLCVIFTIFFIVLLKTSPTGSRIHELFLPSAPTIATQVNEMRKTAIESPLLTPVVNKYTVYLQAILAKLFRIFSPTYLFVEGDQFFLPGRQSFFYYIDFLFIAVGSLFLFTKNKIYFLSIWLFIFVGTLPHIFHQTPGDFSIHIALIFPFMIVLAGAGVAYAIQAASKQIKPFVIGTLLVIYALNVASFSIIYFYQYPLLGTGDFPMRVLTKYIQLAQNKHVPIKVYATSASDIFQKYILYANAITPADAKSISTLLTSPSIDFHGVQFLPCDSAGIDRANGSTVIYDRGCGTKIEGPRTSITTLADGGEIYKIINDKICSKYSLSRYSQHIAIDQFAVEQLSEKNFCEVYISIR